MTDLAPERALAIVDRRLRLFYAGADALYHAGGSISSSTDLRLRFNAPGET